MDNKVVVVCGLGRCGSSLMMQMLSAGGLACTGEAPAYEHPNGVIGGFNGQWLAKQTNKATKVLLPQYVRFEPANYYFIWLDRDPFEQAKSTFKFQHLITRRIHPELPLPKDGSSIMAMMRAAPNETKAGIDAIQQVSPHYQVISFEDLILFGERTAQTVNQFLEADLYIDKMVSVIKPRTTGCNLSMDIERELMEEETDGN